MESIDQQNPRTDEYAEVIEWVPLWDSGAPMPQVFSNGHKTFLIYLCDEPDPNWDGSYVTLVDNKSETPHPLALVEFDGGTFRFGIANDEVFQGLPLWGKGLEGYSAHVIENSTWMNEMKKIHQVHRGYDEKKWEKKKHFMLLFHDEIFEIIATDYKIETQKMTFEKLAMEVVKRMNG